MNSIKTSKAIIDIEPSSENELNCLLQIKKLAEKCSHNKQNLTSILQFSQTCNSYFKSKFTFYCVSSGKFLIKVNLHCFLLFNFKYRNIIYFLGLDILGDFFFLSDTFFKLYFLLTLNISNLLNSS